MRQSLKSLAIGLVASAGIRAHAADYLTVGDPAPSISHVKWLKGVSTQAFESGKLYVVEFWATWCGPCKANIPNLTRLAAKYAGKVSISGIDIWESPDRQDTTYEARVKKFVKDEGDRMAYNVGVDDAGSDTANAWMKAAGEGGIPMSFVVDGDGKIAWLGHAQELESVLDQVLAGKWDLRAAKARRTTEVEDIRPVKEAMDAGHFAQALTLIDGVVARRPSLERNYVYDRCVAHAHIDVSVARSEAERLIKESGGDIGVYQMICSVYASQKDLSPAAYRFGLGLIEQALEKKDRAYMFLSMAGAVCDSLHDRGEALDYAQRAVAAAEKDPHAPAPFVEFLKRNVKQIAVEKLASERNSHG